jgi:hypothetical protein
VYWEIESITDDAAEILGESGAVGYARAGRCGSGGPAIYGTVELVSPKKIEWSIPGHGPIAYLRAGEPVPGDVRSCL